MFRIQDKLASPYYQIIYLFTDDLKGYDFRINWNVDKIAKKSNANGYIVQKIRTEIIGLDGLEREQPYYEAWKVQDGNCEKGKYDYDDRYILDSVFYGFINTSGKITYYSEVYWIDKENELYNAVDNWETSYLVCAGELKSILVDDCQELKNVEPVFIRPQFSWTLKSEE